MKALNLQVRHSGSWSNQTMIMALNFQLIALYASARRKYGPNQQIPGFKLVDLLLIALEVE
jgi:hypothetical protein